MGFMSETIESTIEVGDELAGLRLDQAAAKLWPDYSRSRLKEWILSGELTVDGATLKPKDKLEGGEQLALQVTLAADPRWQAEDIALDIVFEDEAILVINKPRGLVVHPAAGNPDGTLLNAILHHHPGAESVPRAGIVHRLDKDTTGLMVVAKSIESQTHLVQQLQAREVHREYEAVVYGAMTGGGKVDAAIGRHPIHRQKMAVLSHGGKEAVTHYRLLKRFAHHSHIACLLETGRTHQIRVHMAHLNYPLVGDPMYAGRARRPKGAGSELLDCLQAFDRQALHARRLELEHPFSGDWLEFDSELPDDMQTLLATLAAES